MIDSHFTENGTTTLFDTVPFTHYFQCVGSGPGIFEGNDFILETSDGEIVGRQRTRHRLPISLVGDSGLERNPVDRTEFRAGTPLKCNC